MDTCPCPVKMNGEYVEVKSSLGASTIDRISAVLLAGDVGGTKSLLGLFRQNAERPVSTVVREFATPDFDSLDDIVQTFLEETNAGEIEAVCIGVARLTNVPWLADASALAERLVDTPVQLVNDLEAMAHAVPVLEPDELTVLQ